MKNEKLYRQLRAEIEYAAKSYSINGMYQASGKVQMARQLRALTKEQAIELDGEIICKQYLNNAIWRHKGNAGCPKHTSGTRGILYDDGKE